MLRLKLVVLLAIASALTAAAGDLRLEAPSYADPGEVVQVEIYGESLENVSVSLTDRRGSAVSRSEGFPWTSKSGSTATVALLGIPSTLNPGSYHLVVQADEGRARWDLEQNLVVRSRDYPEYVIRLDDKMNTLYADESERKKQEARELWAILTGFDLDAVHHTGAFIPPTDGETVTSEFGDRRRYRMPDGSESASVHFGRDIRGTIGTPVYASGRGRVVLSKERYLTGNTLILEHLPGVYTVYSHLDSLAVRLGEIVSQGELVGSIGETGFATGPHLHWELRVGGTPAAPTQFLNRPLLDTQGLMSKMD